MSTTTHKMLGSPTGNPEAAFINGRGIWNARRNFL